MEGRVSVGDDDDDAAGQMTENDSRGFKSTSFLWFLSRSSLKQAYFIETGLFGWSCAWVMGFWTVEFCKMGKASKQA